jgi:DNA-binding response OmpR family regulator
MVVDSDPDERTLLSEELERHGFSVVTATSAEEALQVAAATPPDAVVLETRLPGMHGLDLMTELLESNVHLPVVIHTATDGLQDHVLAWAADAYLLKQSDLAELIDTLRSTLTHRGRPAPLATTA